MYVWSHDLRVQMRVQRLAESQFYLATAGSNRVLSIGACQRASQRQPLRSTLVHSKYNIKNCIHQKRTKREKMDGEWTNMICPYSINLLDFITKCHGLVGDELREIVRRTLSREKFELEVNSTRPCNDNAQTNLYMKHIISTCTVIID